MPELPEVEHVRRLYEDVLVGHTIVEADFREDSIVFKGQSRESLTASVLHRIPRTIGRRGKLFWIAFEETPVLYAHLGMNGWVREWGTEGMRLHSHGEAPMDDASGEPRFLKFSLTTDQGRKIAFTDSRRLARAWIGDSPEREQAVQKLGPDAWTGLSSANQLTKLISKRDAPVKAVLLDQHVLAGIGNWIADEVLYHGRIAPARSCKTLTVSEVEALFEAIRFVLDTACGANADYTKFPDSWMFHHRWGGGRGAQIIDGHPIVRATVGGRTTAWVPDLQR